MEWADPALRDAFVAAIDTRVRELLGAGAPRWGTVVSIDHGAGTCVVDLPAAGERVARMNMVRPTAAGQEVLLGGSDRDRYVIDVKAGQGLVIGGLQPGDVFASARSPVSGIEALLAGQTITGAQTTYPVCWGNVPSGWRSGSDLVLPDASGRVLVGRDDMGGSDAGRTSIANTIGATGGSRTVTLDQGNLPAVNFNVSDPGHTHGVGSGSNVADTGSARQEPGSSGTATSGSATTGITVSSGGSGIPVAVEQPGMVLNVIIFLGVPVT